MAVTIAGTATALNEHAKVFAPTIKQEVRQTMVTEASMTPVQTTHSYVTPNVTPGDFIQAFQCAFTPKNDVNFDAEMNTLQKGKIDIQFTCEDLEVLWDSWKSEWVEWGKKIEEWTFPRYIYTQVILPKVYEEMELLSYQGTRVEPAAGVASAAFLDAADGLGSKIADAITASKVVPIVTGALTPATIVDQINSFVDAIPWKYRNISTELWLSPTNYRHYIRNYQTTYFAGGLNDSKNMVMVDGTNITLAPKPSMEGSNRLILTPRSNLLVGRRTGEGIVPMIRWQEDDRVLKGLTEFHRFYGVGFFGELFVNDQA